MDQNCARTRPLLFKTNAMDSHSAVSEWKGHLLSCSGQLKTLATSIKALWTLGVAENIGHPNVHEAFHLPGAALPNEFGNQRKERKRKTTCEEHPPLTTWSSKDSIRLHPLNIRHRSLLRLVVLAPFWICFMNLWHLFGYDSWMLF